MILPGFSPALGRTALGVRAMSRILPRNIRQTGDVSLLKPGLSDLSQSIFASLGVLGLANPVELSPARRTALLLVDGMGALQLQEAVGEHLAARPEYAIFQQANQINDGLHSHFPSTTVTNLTSLGTGLLPGEHGMLGYTVRIPQSAMSTSTAPGKLLNALKWDPDIEPTQWQPHQTLFERAEAAGLHVWNIGDKRYAQTGFTQASLRGGNYLAAGVISEFVSQAVVALAEPNSFAYIYTNVLDHAGHNFGVGSEQWLNALSYVANLIAALGNNLGRQTQLFVTSDHGMINAGEKIVIGAKNPLAENLTLIGGEPRMRHIYLKTGSEIESAALWQEYLGDRASVYTKAEAISHNLFGAVVSPQSHARLGDLIVIAHQELVLLDPDRADKESAVIGQHGGITPAEVEIPLLHFSI